MKQYFSNKTDSVSKVTRYIPNDKLSLFTEKDFPLTGGKPRIRDGVELTQVTIFEDLEISIPENLKEMTEIKGKGWVLNSCIREFVVEVMSEAVGTIFTEVGYKAPAEKKVKKAVKDVIEKLFIKCATECGRGKLEESKDDKGNRVVEVIEPCEFMGAEINSLTDLAKMIGA